MFDGSFRTNKREINLAGASASSKSSRKTNLNVARQQRLARAKERARLNGARCLQRSWRGSRGRRGVAAELDDEYQALVGGLSKGSAATHDQRVLSKAASLLAFRTSPALLPFYAFRHTQNCPPEGKKKWGGADRVTEKHLRSDLLSLGRTLRQLRDVPHAISPTASRRIIAVALVLLRQSVHSQPFDKTKIQQENEHLVQLVDCLLEGLTFGGSRGTADLVTNGRPSDYYISVLRSGDASLAPFASGWMINLFLCFRDLAFLHNNNISGEETSSMDVDDDGGNDTGGNVVAIQKLMKWCGRIIVHLAKLEMKQQQEQQTPQPTVQPLLYQQGLALLASILFASSSMECAWVTEPLKSYLWMLEQCLVAQSGEGGNALNECVSPQLLLTHYLSTSMAALSNTTPSPVDSKCASGGSGKATGLMQAYSPNSSSSAPVMEALRDTLTGREFIVLSQVLSLASATTQEERELATNAIPVVLQYTLQHQQDVAVLANFAAQGEDIKSWFSGSKTDDVLTAGITSIAKAAAAAAYEGDDNDEESDDDEQETSPQQQQQQQLQHQQRFSQPPTTSNGRYSRADLQTLPKLDALYQTRALKAKKDTVDRLSSVLRSHGEQVMLLISLAERVGKGEWIQQLGNSLFSPSQWQPPQSLSSVLSPLSLPAWRVQAQSAYTGALSTVMTSCSGIKAGRNASSPLLAKLAFNEHFLHGLWARTSPTVQLITSQSKDVDSSALASACEAFSCFCDSFSHNLLAANDDDFLERYHQPLDAKAPSSQGRVVAKDVVLNLKWILNDLLWTRPVLASDLTTSQSDADSLLRAQRARLLLCATKLWNSLYERWCRLYRVVQFCSEDCWWFPHLASRGKHDNNPIIQSQVTTLGGQGNDEDMDDSSVESVQMEAEPMSADDAGGDALASAFRDPKMARVLTYLPQAMPFSRRVTLFNSLLESDKMRTQDETAMLTQLMRNFEEGDEGELPGRERVTIRRDALYSDSKHRLNRLGKRLRKRVQITFVNKHGQQEAGIDGGGVFKEFVEDLIKDAFIPAPVKEAIGEGEDDDSVTEVHPDFFSVTPLQTLKVNTSLDGDVAMLSHYEFLGRVLGKSIYESILVEPQFCLPFLNKLLGKQNSLDDLKNIDPEYYRNLKSLRHMNAKEIEDLGLTFELHDSATATIELMRGGSNVPVTKQNVIQYIHLVSHQKMNVRGSRQTAAFLRGFRDIIPAQWVRLFSAYELQKLISGDDAVKGIDVRSMMSATSYAGGLHPSQPIVRWLWEVVEEMTPEQQRKFLKFMTSCSRQPLLGFGSMVPAPCVQQTRLREDDRGNDVAEGLGTGNIRLPTSSTCMNLLKLPKYTSKEMLREKLLYAIEAAAGFELS